jgi:hypothetical protein
MPESIGKINISSKPGSANIGACSGLENRRG